MGYGPEHPNERQSKYTDDQWKRIRDWWVDDICVNFRNWIDADVGEAAEFLRGNQVDPVEMIRSKFAGDTRLAVVGMVRHPHMDHLPFELIEQIPGTDFICIEDVAPIDYSQEKWITIRDAEGYAHSMSPKEARREFPEEFRRLEVEEEMNRHAYDNVELDARERGITVLRMTAVERFWMWGRPQQELIEYMQSHPEAKGLYFGTVFSAMKWPGYKMLDGSDQPDFSRPFSYKQSFLGGSESRDPKALDNVQSPAHAAEDVFPGRVYSVVQFAMPHGFGDHWNNLRRAVQASGIQDRFAIDHLPDTPFATEREIVVGEEGLARMPIEELYKLYGTDAQMFFGPVEKTWGQVLDGVIIYPSEKPIPQKPSLEDQIAHATQYFGL